MKKEIMAAVLLVLLTAASFLNCAYVERGVELICCHAQNARLYAQSGDKANAERELEQGREMFMKNQRHSEIFLRHDDIAEISGIFFDARQALAEENLPAAAVICQKLTEALKAVAELQKIKLQSIL